MVSSVSDDICLKSPFDSLYIVLIAIKQPDATVEYQLCPGAINKAEATADHGANPRRAEVAAGLISAITISRKALI